MKRFLCILLCAVSGLLVGADTLYLNPTAVCGCFITTHGGWSRASSSAELRYDAKNLYVNVEFPYPLGLSGKKVPLSPGKKGRDVSAVFAGDVMELQLAPPSQKDVYYHFAFNPAGASYTARKRDTAWNPEGIKSEVRTSWNAWTVSLVIPFEALGVSTPVPGEVWRGNIARTIVFPDGTREVSSWAGASDFHKIDQYGKILFGKPEPGRGLFLKRAEITLDKFVFELTGKELPSKIEADVVADSVTRTAEMEHKNNTIVIQGIIKNDYLPLKCSERLAITLKDGEGNVIFTRNGIMPEFQTDFLWLNTFYCLAGKHDLQYKHAFPGNTTLQILKDDQVVYEEKGTKSEGTVSLKNPQTFPPGRYVVRVSGKSKKTSRVFFILENEPESPVVPPDSILKAEGNILLRNGMPVFLLGISGTQKAFLSFDEAFNLGYAQFGRQNNAVAYGDVPTGARYSHKGSISGYLYPPQKVYEENLRDFLQKPGGQNSIRRIVYEAEIPILVRNSHGEYETQDSAPLMKTIYDFLKKGERDQLYSIQAPLSRAEDFAPACDIFEAVSPRSSYAFSMMGNLNDDMALLRKKVGTKPVIFWLGGTIPNNRCRRAEEIRCALYLAILHDFSGAIIHMGHGYLPADRSRLWSMLSGVCAEIQSFYPIFRKGNEAPGFLRPSDAASFVRETTSAWIAVVVNTSPMEKTIRLTYTENVEAVVLPLEGRTVKSENHSLTETFTPYEPKVIVFRKAIPHSEAGQ